MTSSTPPRRVASSERGGDRLAAGDGVGGAGEIAGAVNGGPVRSDLRPNLGGGGAAKATELSDREREICATLGPALRERGLLFVGIDVIDGNLTEINVTCPTGIRAIARLGGPDIAAKIWDTIEAKRGGK